MSIFKGAGVAIVTPMKENEEVNYEKLQELIEWQIDQGTDAIIIAGTTGCFGKSRRENRCGADSGRRKRCAGRRNF
jgi:dihydrodipicolinate synthase/N-acetylneuraminate lyase